MNISKAGKLGGLLVAMVAAPLQAAEWSVEPSVSAEIFNDDNNRLLSSGSNGTTGINISPAALFARKTEISEVAVDARAHFRKFSGNSALDSNDASVKFMSLFKNERSRWGVDAGVTRDSSLTSEIEDSGRVDIRRRRELLSFSPSWSFNYTEKQSISVSWRYSNSEYDAPASEFQGYTYDVLSATWQYQLSEKNFLQANVYKSNYETDNSSFDSDTTGLQVGFVRSFSPLSSLTVLVGARTTDQVFGSEDGSLLLVSYNFKNETDEMRIDLSRDIQPSSVGQINQADRLVIHWHRSFSKIDFVNIDITYGKNRNAGFGSTSNDRDFLQARVEYKKRFSRKLIAGVVYRYLTQEFVNSGAEADSNRISLILKYTFSKKSVSR